MNVTRLISPRWSAAVIDSGRVWVADAGAQGVSEHSLPFGIMSDPGRLLDLASRTGRASEITMIIDRPPLFELDGGDPRPDTEQLAELAERAAEKGWKASAAAIELGSGWITWTKPGATDPVAVHMGIRRMMATPLDPTGLIRDEDTPAQLAERLARYAKLTGASYRSMPGVAGLGALRNIYDRPTRVRRNIAPSGAKTATPDQYIPRPQPRFIWNAPEPLVGAGDLIWRRTPTAQERRTRSAVTFDVRAAYLAAAAGARLGWHAPKNTGAITWDPAQSGLYRIRTAGEEWCSATRGLPIVNPNRINSDRTTWVAGPVLAMLSERGYALPEIIDSWTCAGVGGRDTRGDITGPYLKEWADQLRDALPDAMTAGDEVLRAAIKRTYTMAIGLLARPGGRVYRQDWAATIIDEARCRLIRKVNHVNRSIGLVPLQVRTDAVTYAVDTAEDVEALSELLGVGSRIGHFRIEREQPMAEYLDTMTRQAAARRRLRGGK
jgi:hypothetical protein